MPSYQCNQTKKCTSRICIHKALHRLQKVGADSTCANFYNHCPIVGQDVYCCELADSLRTVKSLEVAPC